MVTFQLTDTNLVISSVNGTTILVYNTAGNIYATKIRPSNWSHVATVGVGLSYDKLDIAGTIFGNQTMKALAKDLLDSRLSVNREGYCFLKTDGITNKAFGIECYRLNDIFGFSKYELEPLVTTVWRRCDMYSDKEITNALEEKKWQDSLKRVKDLQDELADSKQDLANVDKELLESRKELLEKEYELYKREAEVTELQETLSDYIRILKEMVEELDKRREKLAELENELKVQDTVLKEKDAEMESYKTQLNHRKAELSELRRLLENKIKELEDCKTRGKGKETGKPKNDKSSNCEKLLEKMRIQLTREREHFKTAIDSLATSLKDMNASLQKQVD